MTHPVLVNRTRTNATLESKAILTGFRYILPDGLATGELITKQHARTKAILHTSRTHPFSIQDVDGTIKRTVRTAFFEADGVTPHERKPEIGVYTKGLAGKYHGHLSRNWQPALLTLKEIIDTLNAGFAVAPGHFDNPPDKSCRSGDYCESADVILADLDAWPDPHAAPGSIAEFLEMYPDAEKDFYWLGESVSSRSFLKPELRLRGMIVLPEPVRRGQHALWETVIDAFAEKYPMMDRGVGIDKVRLSFGNARADCENRVLRGRVSEAQFAAWKRIAAAKMAAAAEAEGEQAKQRETQAEHRRAQRQVRLELKARGHTLQETQCPIVAWNETPIDKILTAAGCTHLKETEWNWHESGPGKSFDLYDDAERGPRLVAHSGTTKNILSQFTQSRAASAHRFMAFYHFGLDMKKAQDKNALREALSRQGYGTSPDAYKAAKTHERRLAYKENLIFDDNRKAWEPRPPKLTRKPKLTRTEPPEPRPTETIDANQTARRQAIDTFHATATEMPEVSEVGETICERPQEVASLDGTPASKLATSCQIVHTVASRKPCNAPTSADAVETDTTLHIHLVNDATGTGKSHDEIEITASYQRRTIALLKTTDLARQAADTAFDKGFLRTLHIRGRGTNWDKSEIAAIPVDDRTADLFDEKQVLCINFDAVQQYQEKRIAAHTFCRFKCPFFDDCPFFAQYTRASEADFISTSNPNLFFDLAGRGYLKSLLKPKAEDTETDTDGVNFGTAVETETPPRKSITHGIVDDYAIDGLYTDIVLRAAEWKRLKSDWKGTPTGKFAKAVHKALKQDTPATILQALRKAFADSEAHHAEIAETLTQHARGGRIAYADRPKGCKETQRVLSEKEIQYDDGGKAVIPVDIAAYHALRKAGIPTIDPKPLKNKGVGDSVVIPTTPQKALLVGNLDLADLTPLWQVGATPIDTLRIFFDAIGNDANAPLKGYTPAGDTIVTYTLPPQAPTETSLETLTMLSATADPHAVRRAFDGQTGVTFSEHSGGAVEWAKGVKVFQFSESKVTSGSVFESALDDAGERVLTGLTATATADLARYNAFAEVWNGKTVFISYREFDDPDSDFRKAVSNFDTRLSFDKVDGINLDGYTLFVIYGSPKASHAVVMEMARKQHVNDSEPLPTGEYQALTDEVTQKTPDGVQVIERRYIDDRLEQIRQQLVTDKLIQSGGRARHPRWENTLTLLHTSTPIPNVTREATLFTRAALKHAETPQAIPDAQARIEKAIETGDVQAVMATKGIGKSQAYAHTRQTRDAQKQARDREIRRLHLQGLSSRAIEKQLAQDGKHKVSRNTIARVVRVSQNSSPLYSTIYRQSEKWDTSETNVDKDPIKSGGTGLDEFVHPGVVHPDSDVETLTDTKQARATEIVRLHDQGLSLRAIHKQIAQDGKVRASYGTIANVVRAYKNGNRQLKRTHWEAPNLYTPENADDTPLNTESSPVPDTIGSEPSTADTKTPTAPVPTVPPFPRVENLLPPPPADDVETAHIDKLAVLTPAQCQELADTIADDVSEVGEQRRESRRCHTVASQRKTPPVVRESQATGSRLDSGRDGRDKRESPSSDTVARAEASDNSVVSLEAVQTGDFLSKSRNAPTSAETPTAIATETPTETLHRLDLATAPRRKKIVALHRAGYSVPHISAALFLNTKIVRDCIAEIPTPTRRPPETLQLQSGASLVEPAAFIKVLKTGKHSFSKDFLASAV